MEIVNWRPREKPSTLEQRAAAARAPATRGFTAPLYQPQSIALFLKEMSHRMKHKEAGDELWLLAQDVENSLYLGIIPKGADARFEFPPTIDCQDTGTMADEGPEEDAFAGLPVLPGNEGLPEGAGGDGLCPVCARRGTRHGRRMAHMDLQAMRLRAQKLEEAEKEAKAEAKLAEVRRQKTWRATMREMNLHEKVAKAKQEKEEKRERAAKKRREDDKARKRTMRAEQRKSMGVVAYKEYATSKRSDERMRAKLRAALAPRV